MKKAVVIMPHLHDYPDKVKEALLRLGYESSIYFEAPPTLSYVRLRRLSRIIGVKKAFYHFNKSLMDRINEENQDVDRFIVIRGETLDYDMIKEFIKRVMSNGGKCTYYTWDSFKNQYFGGKLGELFQKRLSFDPVDVKNNNGWDLLPLFYSKEYDIDQDKDIQIDYEYDLSCVTGLSLQKYQQYERIKAANPALRINCKMFLNKRLYKIKQITDKRFRHMDKDVIIHQSMSGKDIIELYNKSRAVLDLPSLSQSGLTMRTMESLGLKQKLVTTNRFVKEYDFYSNGNIWVLEGDFKINQDWFSKPYILDESIREKYSIDSWCKHLLQEE